MNPNQEILQHVETHIRDSKEYFQQMLDHNMLLAGKKPIFTFTSNNPEPLMELVMEGLQQLDATLREQEVAKDPSFLELWISMGVYHKELVSKNISRYLGDMLSMESDRIQIAIALPSEEESDVRFEMTCMIQELDDYEVYYVPHEKMATFLAKVSSLAYLVEEE